MGGRGEAAWMAGELGRRRRRLRGSLVKPGRLPVREVFVPEMVGLENP